MTAIMGYFAIARLCMVHTQWSRHFSRWDFLLTRQ